MIVDLNNYHSNPINQSYMSNSQYKAWLECAARQSAVLRGDWAEEEKAVFLIGKYVDQALLTPETFPAFVEQNRPDIYTKQDSLRAPFQMADAMIERCRRDKYFMGVMRGEAQKLITFELFGVQFRSLLDVINIET